MAAWAGETDAAQLNEGWGLGQTNREGNSQVEVERCCPVGFRIPPTFNM